MDLNMKEKQAVNREYRPVIRRQQMEYEHYWTFPRKVDIKIRVE
jgi:hypothetical protein